MSDRLVTVGARSPSGHGGRGIYWVLKNVILGPAIRKLFRPIEEGAENVPEHGAGDPGQQPPVVRRLAVHAARRWTAG